MARDSVEISRRKIYEKSNDDPHYLLFDKYDALIHEPFREMLRKCKNLSVSHFLKILSRKSQRPFYNARVYSFYSLYLVLSLFHDNVISFLIFPRLDNKYLFTAFFGRCAVLGLEIGIQRVDP